jgi:general secretion pathway protein I
MRRARGFTLIEVLVALIVVALGMSALMGALTSAADNTGRLREKSFAEWVGLNQLAAARLKTGGPPAIGKSEGDVEFAGGRWHWLQQVSKMEIPGVLRIEVQVRRLPGAAKEESGEKAAASASAGDNVPDKGPPDWLATVTGFRGDQIAAPDGTLDQMDSTQQASGGGGGTGSGGGSTSPTPTTTVTPRGATQGGN